MSGHEGQLLQHPQLAPSPQQLQHHPQQLLSPRVLICRRQQDMGLSGPYSPEDSPRSLGSLSPPPRAPREQQAPVRQHSLGLPPIHTGRVTLHRRSHSSSTAGSTESSSISPQGYTNPDWSIATFGPQQAAAAAMNRHEHTATAHEVQQRAAALAASVQAAAVAARREQAAALAAQEKYAAALAARERAVVLARQGQAAALAAEQKQAAQAAREQFAAALAAKREYAMAVAEREQAVVLAARERAAVLAAHEQEVAIEARKQAKAMAAAAPAASRGYGSSTAPAGEVQAGNPNSSSAAAVGSTFYSFIADLTASSSVDHQPARNSFGGSSISSISSLLSSFSRTFSRDSRSKARKKNKQPDKAYEKARSKSAIALQKFAMDLHAAGLPDFEVKALATRCKPGDSAYRAAGEYGAPFSPSGSSCASTPIQAAATTALNTQAEEGLTIAFSNTSHANSSQGTVSSSSEVPETLAALLAIVKDEWKWTTTNATVGNNSTGNAASSGAAAAAESGRAAKQTQPAQLQEPDNEAGRHRQAGAHSRSSSRIDVRGLSRSLESRPDSQAEQLAGPDRSAGLAPSASAVHRQAISFIHRIPQPVPAVLPLAGGRCSSAGDSEVECTGNNISSRTGSGQRESCAAPSLGTPATPSASNTTTSSSSSGKPAPQHNPAMLPLADAASDRTGIERSSESNEHRISTSNNSRDVAGRSEINSAGSATNARAAAAAQADNSSGRQPGPQQPKLAILPQAEKGCSSAVGVSRRSSGKHGLVAGDHISTSSNSTGLSTSYCSSLLSTGQSEMSASSPHVIDALQLQPCLTEQHSHLNPLFSQGSSLGSEDPRPDKSSGPAADQAAASGSHTEGGRGTDRSQGLRQCSSIPGVPWVQQQQQELQGEQQQQQQLKERDLASGIFPAAGSAMLAHVGQHSHVADASYTKTSSNIAPKGTSTTYIGSPLSQESGGLSSSQLRPSRISRSSACCDNSRDSNISCARQFSSGDSSRRNSAGKHGQRSSGSKLRKLLLWTVPVLLVLAVLGVGVMACVWLRKDQQQSAGAAAAAVAAAAVAAGQLVTFKVVVAVPANTVQHGCSTWLGSDKSIGAYQRLFVSAYSAALQLRIPEGAVSTVSCSESTVFASSGSHMAIKPSRLLLKAAAQAPAAPAGTGNQPASAEGQKPPAAASHQGADASGALRSLQQLKESSATSLDVTTLFSIPESEVQLQYDRAQFVQMVVSRSAGILGGPLSRFFDVPAVVVKAVEVLEYTTIVRQAATLVNVASPGKSEVLESAARAAGQVVTAAPPAAGGQNKVIPAAADKAAAASPNAALAAAFTASDVAAVLQGAPPPESVLKNAPKPWDLSGLIGYHFDSYMSAATCYFAPTKLNSIADDQGRFWSWNNGSACVFRPANANQSRSTSQVTWDTAGTCDDALNAGNSVEDDDGRLWGWQNEASCAFRSSKDKQQVGSSVTGAQGGVMSHAHGKGKGAVSFQEMQDQLPGRVSVVWEAAPTCTLAPNESNAVPDTFARLWGWEAGRSCAFRWQSLPN